jgi:hypothetical protein
MINTLEQFGRNAGKVWEALNKTGNLTEEKLIEITSLRSYEFYIAIGWLARENKIYKDNKKYTLNKTNLDNKIGNDAGKIWHLLNKKGEIEVTSIFNLLNIEENDAYSAIGWLARENKIQLNIGELQNHIKKILEKSY